MKNRFYLMILPLISLILEILPYGAVLNFAIPNADGSIGHKRELYSYFDFMPFGYANFAPLATAILTCSAIALLIVYQITGKASAAKISMHTLLITALVSLGPLLYGTDYFTLVGLLITISLAAEALILYVKLKKE